MTVERRSLPDDVGSNVLRMVVDELNRGLGTTVVAVQAQTGSVDDGSTSFDISAGAAAIGCIAFVAEEDIYLTGIDMFFTVDTDNATGIVLDVLLPAENTNAAPDPGTNALIFASDGAGPLFATGTLTDVSSLTAVSAGTGLDANAFTNVTGAHGAITATDFTGNVRLNRGQKIRCLLTELGAGAEGCTIYFHYRPIKDEISLVDGGVQNVKFAAQDR